MAKSLGARVETADNDEGQKNHNQSSYDDFEIRRALGHCAASRVSRGAEELNGDWTALVPRLRSPQITRTGIIVLQLMVKLRRAKASPQEIVVLEIALNEVAAEPAVLPAEGVPSEK